MDSNIGPKRQLNTNYAEDGGIKPSKIPRNSFETGNSKISEVEFIPLPCTPSLSTTEPTENQGISAHLQGILYQSPEPVSPELQKMMRVNYCELCSSRLESPMNAKSHYSGKIHEKKLRNWQIENDRRKLGVELQLYCKYCDKNFSSAMMAQSHYTGKKHISVVKNGKIANATIDSATGAVIRSETAKEDKTGRFGIGLGFLSLTKPTLGGHKFTCEPCGISCSNQSSLDDHLRGSKHKKKCPTAVVEPSSSVDEGTKDNLLTSVLKPSPAVGPSDLSIYRTPSGHYYCRSCDMTLNSSSVYKEHINGKRHKSKHTNKN